MRAATPAWMWRSRSGRESRGGGARTPFSTRRWRRPSVSIDAVAGAQRAGIDAEDDHAVRCGLAGRRRLQLLLGDVGVVPDVLDVVVVLEGLDQLQHLLGLGALEGDVVVGELLDLGLVGLDARPS